MRGLEKVSGIVSRLIRSWYISLALVIVLVDQLLKMSDIPQILNTGIFLGIPIPFQLILLIWTLGLLGVLFSDRIQTKEAIQLKSVLMFILIVSASNLIDRGRFGAVVDYIHVGGVWMNLTDIAISICMAIVILEFISNLFKQNESKIK